MSWMNLINGVRAPCEQARVEAGDDPELQTGIHQDLAWVAFYLGDLDEALAEARAAVDWVATETATVTRADAIATLAFIEFIRGDAGPAALSEAVALQEIAMSTGSWTEGSVYTPPGLMLGLELMWMGRLDEARDVLEGELAQYELRGMYIVRQEVLCYLAELECRAGRWERAVRIADESMDIVQETGQAATQSQVALFNQAWPRALLGRIDEAREQATTGVRLAEANDDRFNAAWNHAVLGFIDLSLADLEGARRNLEPAVAWLDRLHAAEPGDHPVRAGSRRGARRPRADRRGGTAPPPSRGAGPGARPGLGDGPPRSVAERSSPPPPAISTPPNAPPRHRSDSSRATSSRSRPRDRCWSSARSIGGRSESVSRGNSSAAPRRIRGARGATLGGPGRRGARPDRRSAVDAVRADRDRADHRLARRPRVTRTRRSPTRCSSARARSRRTSSASTRSSASGRGRSWRRRSICPPSPDRTRSRSSNVPVREVPPGSSVPSVIDEPRLRLADTEGSR